MKEKLFKYLTVVAALCAILFLIGIIFSIFSKGLPAFFKIGFFDFLFGTSWHPTHIPHEFGMLPLLLASIVITVGALVIALPLGIGAAIYMSELASPTIRELLKPIVELLAGVPSVIYGLIGMAFLSPLVRKVFGLAIGLNGLTASIILGFMVVPIIASISEDALSSVPKSLREASFALGANQWETIIKVILPAAKSGVLASIVLGFGRAIGETMVVLMVAGGSPVIPKTLLQPMRPMTSAIAAEMGETMVGSTHFQALFAVGIVLFVITFVSNLITELFIKKK